MKIKVYKDRGVFLPRNDVGTEGENLATTLRFEFPETVMKGDVEIETSKLNKYIVFSIDSPNNTDIIYEDKYEIKKEITDLGRVTACIYLKEFSEEDMTEKLIWISDAFLLTFDKSISQGEIVITEEKIDIFNSLYTSLNLEIIKVQELQEYIEQFKKDVEAGKYKGEPGYTPQKGKDYFTQEDIDEIVKQVFEHDNMKKLENRIKLLEDIEKNNTFIIVEKGEKNAN